jgi:hypothetical protein
MSLFAKCLFIGAFAAVAAEAVALALCFSGAN